MNGVTRGARLWAVVDGAANAVIILDRSPDGWWVELEGVVDASNRPVIESRSSRHLYPTKGTAEGSKK